MYLGKLSRLLVCGASVATIITVTPINAAGQDVNGFINLMGRVIEQDMRNEQIKREQRAYEAEQQAYQAEEKRREVALVRRLQAAMKSLGFYASKVDGDRGPGTRSAEDAFTAAFGMPPIDLTEEEIRQIEQIASRGFRSHDEMQRAAAGGFQRREDYIAATTGGFTTASDYFRARELGFASARDHFEFQRSGFGDPLTYRQAKGAGFESRAEYEAAAAKGFADKRQYGEFLKSGLPDKASYQKRQDEIVLQRALMKDCEAAASASQVDKAIHLCLKALEVGNEPAALKSPLGQIASNLSAKMAEIDTKPAPTAGEAPLAADEKDQREVLARAVRVTACAGSVADEDWQGALAKCSPEAAGDDLQVANLRTRVQAELARVRKVAEEEAQRKRSEAEAQRKKVALDQARQRMAALLQDVAEFTASRPRLGNPINLASAVVALRQMGSSDDYRAIEQAVLTLNDVLSAEETYARFIAMRSQAQAVAATNARATALAELDRTEKFIQGYIAENLLDASVSDLLKLKDDMDKAVADGQDQQIFSMQAKALQEITRLRLKEQLAAFIYQPDTQKNISVQTASNGLALTPENRDLLEGEAKDILVLGNFTKSAPHLVMNLLGELKFYNGTVDYCWFRARDDMPSGLSSELIDAFQGFDGRKYNSQGSCRGQDGLQYDVVLLERGDFLQGNVMDTQAIVDSFSSQKLKLIHTVRWDEVGAGKARLEATAEQIQSEVLAGLRKGHGFLQVATGSGDLCLVLNEDVLAVHEEVHKTLGDTLKRALVKTLDRKVMSAEAAFMGAQKEQCGAIYASSENLKTLISAMDRAGSHYSTLPIWITEDEVRQARQSLASRQVDEAQRLAQIRQEKEAAEQLARKNAEEESSRRARDEAALRDHYGQEAQAAFNDIVEDAEGYFRTGQSRSGVFEAAFPQISDWKRSQGQGGWELDKYDDALVDYGTAVWKGRRLEAVVAKIELVNRNAMRGEYEVSCFIVAYLIDREFGLRRDSYEARCESSDWKTWQTGRSFDSRWKVN
ncbi:MAG: hypothetical protein K0M55_04245 [Rhizobium sp.]|nr:hypothetical protein [Rhizobium sp.]